MSIYFAREAEKKGIEVDFPFLLATTAAAALDLAVRALGERTAPDEYAGPFPREADRSDAAVDHHLGAGRPWSSLWRSSSQSSSLRDSSTRAVPSRSPSFPTRCKLAEPLLVIAEAEPIDHAAPVPTLSDRVERSSVPVAILVAALAAWVYYHFAVKQLGLDLNSLNTVLFGLALLVHRNVANFNRALQAAILSCWPIVVMYHLYGGVAGLLQFTTLGTHDRRGARDGVHAGTPSRSSPR